MDQAFAIGMTVLGVTILCLIPGSFLTVDTAEVAVITRFSKFSCASPIRG